MNWWITPSILLACLLCCVSKNKAFFSLCCKNKKKTKIHRGKKFSLPSFVPHNNHASEAKVAGA
jgi:hypothetical protein